VAALAVTVGVTAVATSASAQKAPPNWDTLVKCAQTPDEAARLACYDSAMRAAGYAPNPAAVAEEHRKAFGLTVPNVNVFKHKKREEGAQAAGANAPPPEENTNRIELTVDQVAVTQPVGKIVVFTTEGQIWQQTDTTQVNTLPREGDSFEVHKEALGGYFCDVNKYQSIRCKRVK
jgi:hypothetical protein